jgi:hypothetical protein
MPFASLIVFIFERFVPPTSPNSILSVFNASPGKMVIRTWALSAAGIRKKTGIIIFS